MVKHRVPNIVRGGVAIPLNKTNYYLVRGRKHEQGGIDIGKNPRTGLEVEDGEVVHVGDKELRVFSAEPILGGTSPSQLVVRGVNPNKVFAAQERFKQVNGIKDDGTKAKLGKRKYIGSNEKNPAKQNADVRRKYWNYDTKLLQVVSDISSQYGIDPKIVISRMSREGIIDEAINVNNRIITGAQYDAEEIKNKSILDIPHYSDLFTFWGLDTIFDRVKKGYTKTNRPIYLERNEVSNEVEGVNSGTVKNNYDALELLIAELASRQKEVKNKYPNLTSDELNSATLANYNATTSYFNKLMKDGTYKTKYALNDDVDGIIIPKPKKYKNKEDNVNYHVEKDLPTYDIMVEYYDKLNKLPSYKKYFNNPEERLDVSREDSFRKMIEDSRINYYNDNHTLPYGTNYNHYNPYLDENREEIKRLGGNMKHKLVEVNIGGNSKLIRVAKPSSTGKSERSEVRKKAQYGTPGKKYFEDGTVFATNGSILNNKLSIDDKLSKPIIAPPSNKPIYSYANESYLEPIITNPLKLYYDNKELLYPIKKPINPSEAISVDNVKKHIGKAPISPIADKKSFFKSNISDIIGVGSNIIGSLITKRINNKSLDSLTYQKPPVALMPSKLKTKININPQLDKMRESLADYERLISGNTASSRVALGRINRVRSQGITNTNELYGQKENMETQLINQDAMNQQRVLDRNLQQDYQYRASKNAFENEVRNLKAENKVANVQNIVTGIQDLLTRREQRDMFGKTLTSETLANPNLPAEMYLKSGIWSKELYDMYRSQYPSKA